jgi:hypothetical protein
MRTSKEDPPLPCPKCGEPVELVRNYTIDFKMEIIPLCLANPSGVLM